jgi:hypothetical protein
MRAAPSALFHRREPPVGPPVGERISRAQAVREAEAAGLRLRMEHRFLPHQYFLEFTR